MFSFISVRYYTINELPLEQCPLNFAMVLNHLEILLKKVLGPTPRVSDLVGLGWDLRTDISNKLPDGVGVTGSETTL